MRSKAPGRKEPVQVINVSEGDTTRPPAGPRGGGGGGSTCNPKTERHISTTYQQAFTHLAGGGCGMQRGCLLYYTTSLVARPCSLAPGLQFDGVEGLGPHLRRCLHLSTAPIGLAPSWRVCAGVTLPGGGGGGREDHATAWVPRVPSFGRVRWFCRLLGYPGRGVHLQHLMHYGGGALSTEPRRVVPPS
jgi:hypothetical protein